MTNELWGFESSCFVCEASNEHGLRIPFFHDTEAATVNCTFCLGAAYSGAPRFVHGGIILAVLDESMAWAAIAIAQRLALTKETTTRFERPVRLEQSYSVVARITDQDDSRLRTRAELFNDKARRCAYAEATFTVLSKRAATAAIGVAASAPKAYFRDGRDEAPAS